MAGAEFGRWDRAALETENKHKPGSEPNTRA
jgi:hypothetical protein